MHQVQLLHASVDEQDESEFLILVDGKHVKYLIIDGGLYDPMDLCFPPTFASLLPPLPSGDWNDGHISLNETTAKPHFAAVTNNALPGIQHLWHPTKVEYLDLTLGESLRSSVYPATCDLFDKPMIAKFARFPMEIPQLELETEAYEWLERSGIAPRFIGHIMEHGRGIGFLMERIDHFRHATLDDLEPCRNALAKLHAKGITHGDINKHNFLVHDDGAATLIDFDSATKDASVEELQDEMKQLEQKLGDQSHAGGRVVEVGF